MNAWFFIFCNFFCVCAAAAGASQNVCLLCLLRFVCLCSACVLSLIIVVALRSLSSAIGKHAIDPWHTVRSTISSYFSISLPFFVCLLSCTRYSIWAIFPENVCNIRSFTVRRREEIEENSTTSFHPEYAHQIFGENESIFGYKDLRVRLFYTAGPLNIYLGTKYTGKVDDISKDGMKADDVVGKVTKLLATGCFYTNIDEFLSKLAKEESFQPFGEKIHSWTIEADKNEVRTFEIYECNKNTPGFLAYHARLQTFLLWFVDAASYIDIEDPQWQFFVWLVF